MPQLSNLDELVLLAIASMSGDAYGVSIQDALRQAGSESSLGAIYVSLERLESGGLVKSELGAPSPSRGGRRKRLFRSTARGKAALAKAEQIRGRLQTLRGVTA